MWCGLVWLVVACEGKHFSQKKTNALLLIKLTSIKICQWRYFQNTLKSFEFHLIKNLIISGTKIFVAAKSEWHLSLKLYISQLLVVEVSYLIVGCSVISK